MGITHRHPFPCLAFLVLLPSIFCAAPVAASMHPIRVLILSGSSDHDRQTTPALRDALEKTGRFAVSVTEAPEKLTAASLEKFDVVVSNYNTLATRNDSPRAPNWPESARTALLDFVRKGKGYVTINASGFSFQDWPEYDRLTLGQWKAGQSGHGKPHEFEVRIEPEGTDLVRRSPHFTIIDRLWHGVAFQPSVKVIATARSSKESGGSGKAEPIAVCGDFGRGRSFCLLLGHDTAAMRNDGFQRLFTRATEWAAVGWTVPLRWLRETNSTSLTGDDKVVWRFNHDPKYGKPFFDPIAIPNHGTSSITRAFPPGEASHYGLWFSWKFINGVNYWDEDPKARRAAGLTTWKNVKYDFQDGMYTRISMDLEYGLPKLLPVLTEKRTIEVSPQDPDSGWYTMNWTMTFTAREDVTLADTPVLAAPGGAEPGSHGGLSLRLRQLTDLRLMTTNGPVKLDEKGHFRGKATAFAYGGETGGPFAVTVAIADHPDNPNYPTSWHAIGNNTMNYISAAVLDDAPINVKAGESFTLRYLIYVHLGVPEKEEHLKWMADELAKEGRKSTAN